MKRWTLQSTPFWRRRKIRSFLPWASHYPVAFTSWSSRSALLSSSYPQLWCQKQPLPRRILLCCHSCLYSGFSSRGQELRCGVKGCQLQLQLRKIFFSSSLTPQQGLTPEVPGLLERSFPYYLMSRLLATEHDKAARPYRQLRCHEIKYKYL